MLQQVRERKLTVWPATRPRERDGISQIHVSERVPTQHVHDTPKSLDMFSDEAGRGEQRGKAVPAVTGVSTLWEPAKLFVRSFYATLQDWNSERVNAAMHEGRDNWISPIFPQLFPVLIFYLTCWPWKRMGNVHFFRDIYDATEPLGVGVGRRLPVSQMTPGACDPAGWPRDCLAPRITTDTDSAGAKAAL